MKTEELWSIPVSLGGLQEYEKEIEKKMGKKKAAVQETQSPVQNYLNSGNVGGGESHM